ncbi:MAG: PAS domain S-box protein [Chloroflexi bacterium]|nr:PAS domain S-box protein [Chloroflexota bacterium]
MTQRIARDWTELRQTLFARREAIVDTWKTALAPTGYVALSAAELRVALASLTERVLDALSSEPFAPTLAHAVGVELVQIGYARSQAITRTLEVFGGALAAGLPDSDLVEVQPRLAAVLAEIGGGFAHQIAERILAEQETIRQALLTQRQQAEQALRESEARFRAIFEGAPFGIAVADMQGRILAANPALQSILGFTEDEMRGRVILAELAHPADAAAGFRQFVELAEGRAERYETEQRFFTRGGRLIWAQLAMALVRDAGGQPRFAIGMGHDITESKQAEAERMQLLREQAARAEAEAAQARLSFLAESSTQLASSLDYETTLGKVAQSVVPRLADWCVLSLLDQAGNLRTVASNSSSSGRQLLEADVRATSQASSPFVDVLHSGTSRLIPEIDDAMLQTFSLDEEQLRRWRHLALRSAMVVPLPGQRGLLGTLALVTTSESDRHYTASDLALAEDLARRAALAVENAQLYAQAQAAIHTAEAAVRAREDFLSVAAHELKTPVTSLRGFAQLTLRALDQAGELDRGRLRHALTVVNQQSDKLRRLVAQLLDISRIQSGRLALELRPVDVNELVAEIVTAMQNQSQQHTLLVVGPHLPEMNIDPLRIEQVLTNLVDNAIKFSPQGGPIEIECSTPDVDQVEIAVRDHGPGIPPDHREHIFERFYQAGEGQSNAAGMGLGLYISREIVELHGGAIRAEFPEDGGARFVLALPLSGGGRG